MKNRRLYFVFSAMMLGALAFGFLISSPQIVTADNHGDERQGFALNYVASQDLDGVEVGITRVLVTDLADLRSHAGENFLDVERMEGVETVGELIFRVSSEADFTALINVMVHGEVLVNGERIMLSHYWACCAFHGTNDIDSYIYPGEVLVNGLWFPIDGDWDDVDSLTFLTDAPYFGGEWTGEKYEMEIDTSAREWQPLPEDLWAEWPEES